MDHVTDELMASSLSRKKGQPESLSEIDFAKPRINHLQEMRGL
jgi:hypothetical protein